MQKPLLQLTLFILLTRVVLVFPTLLKERWPPISTGLLPTQTQKGLLILWPIWHINRCKIPTQGLRCLFLPVNAQTKAALRI